MGAGRRRGVGDAGGDAAAGEGRLVFGGGSFCSGVGCALQAQEASLNPPPHSPHETTPQALLVQFVGGLRQATAARADERVRLTGEVISGALAMKMLGWEEPFTDAICDIRKQVGRGCVCGFCGGDRRQGVL